jgi:hypothetical protein
MASSTFEKAGRRTIVAPALVVAAAMALWAAGAARAEAPRSDEAIRDAARAKLVEGVEALRRGEPQAALDRFREAYALVPSPKIHYDIGLAYLSLGRPAEALSAFERFVAEAQDAPADKRKNATLQTAALRSQVGAVAIAVEGAPDGTVIAVDGREVGLAPSVRVVYVDPGGHQISLRLPGGGSGPVQRIEILAGGSMEVVLRVDSGGAVPAALPAGPEPRPPPSASLALASASDGQAPTVAAGSRQAGTGRIVALSLGAAGVVLIGAGVTFGVLAQNEGDSLSRDSANGAPPHMPTPFDPDKESRGMAYQTLQVIGLATGAVALAAGIVVYATTRGHVTVEPVAARSLMGANLQASF